MTKLKIVWSKEAIKKVKVIYNHIVDNFSIELAEKFYKDLMEFCDHLIKFPKLGKLSVKFNNLREYHFEGNTIYYKIFSESEILIVTLHPRKTLLKKVKKK